MEDIRDDMTYGVVEDAEANLTEAKSRYLRRWGWKPTCNTPGAYWLWERDFKDEDAQMAAIHEKRKLPSPHVPYGVMKVPTDMAISMTLKVLDERPELGDGEG